MPRVRALSELSNRPFLRKSGLNEVFGGETVADSHSSAPARRHSHAVTRTSMQKISEIPEKHQKKPNSCSLMGILKKGRRGSTTIDLEETFKMDEEDEDEDEDEDEENDYSSESEDEGRLDSVDDKVRKKEMRKGIDLATTLERIEKIFVITDPRLPDNPIIFASDSFLELTEYSREEILGRNCRDLKPENVLIQQNGHISLTDFDLSCLTSCKPQLLIPVVNEKKKHHKSHKGQEAPIFLAEPMRASNSFVGTEEYIAPVSTVFTLERSIMKKFERMVA